MSIVRTALVEGTDRRVYAVPVSCGDDRPHAGRGARLVLTSHGAHARGPLLRGGTRMDHQRDSCWIEPLEATALSADEEAEAQTTISVEGAMNWTASGVDFRCDIRRRDRGRTD